MNALTKTNTMSFIKQALVVFTLMVAGLMLFSYLPVHAQGGLINPTDQPTKLADATGGQGSFRGLLLTFLNFFLGFLGLLAVVMVIYGGVLYVSSAGGENVDKAKKIIMYAVIGIVVIFLSFALVNTLLGGLGSGQDQ